ITDESFKQEFCEWFWTGTNGNNLIKELNKYAIKNKTTDDRIRREKDGPVIYAIVLDKFDHGLESPFYDEACKLVKVGYTHVSVKTGSDNRMEKLKKKIKNKYPDSKPTIKYRFPIGCGDTTPAYDVERRIREKFGEKVHADEIEKLNLPVTTEWVLTTQSHLDKITKASKKAKTDCIADLIDIFKDIKPPAKKEKGQKEEAPATKGGVKRKGAK
uniref:Uncharacterized protein n=1 Tax=Clytia hemisphaerica TaxID=252671 RepID=A0A7M5XPA4_9CNID